MIRRNAWLATRDTLSRWQRHKAQRLGAAIAFYSVLSLSPLLVIVVAVAGRILGAAAVRGEIVTQFADLIGPGAARQIESMIIQASRPRADLVAAVLGVAALLIGATGVFGELKDALDTVWEVPPRAQGLWSVIRGNLLSLAMIMGVAFLLLVSLVFSAAVAGLAHWAGGLIPSATVTMIRLADDGVSFVVTTTLFAMIYRILPEARISWRDVWIGAAVTALLFDGGKLLIGLYLGRSAFSSIYGAAGSFVIILVWIYYSAAVFLLGAEFTAVFAARWGSRKRPFLAQRERRVSR